ncbi:MAG: bifunctional acetate--CoA ligase family protein/GNAT family N-acetyltransferase [Betaproteobacteria bacterium]
MTTRNLEYLFAPRSVAIIGASARAGSVGAAVTRNLLGGGFAGELRLVNPRHDRIGDHVCAPDVRSLDIVPDLAVICTPPETVPGVIEALGERGGRAAIVLTAGLGAAGNGSGRTLSQAMLDAAQPYLLRILGPNCVGLLAPHIGLNASFAQEAALPGSIAFVSQSGALTTALLDWARARQVGFSHFVSLGDCADVDFGDVIDYLATDARTRSILLYMESITHARKFMSAARAAARNKPIIVVKAGRAPEGVRAAASHTGALAGADAVFDAAFRRAGALRVMTTGDLFVAAETLACARPLAGDRLTILTNGGGPGVLAADAASLGGAQLAVLSDATSSALDAVLPATWSHGNPVDIIGDAPTTRYVEAIRILTAQTQSDALLFIHAPTAIVDSTSIATACAPLLRDCAMPVFSCWLGGNAVAQARRLFVDAGIPTYETPEQAVSAFLQGMQYRRNQEILFETPSSKADAFVPDAVAARAVVDKALGENRSVLNEPETKAILAAYGIPVVPTRIARDVEEAGRVASELGFPVVLKILAPDISHKSDVGGVVLDIRTPEMLVDAAQKMLERVRELRPQAALHGFSVQQMVKRAHAHELIVGAATDAAFGPIILFGQGGTATEQIADTAIALPPLNAYLARDLMSRTRVARQLAGYRDRPAADHKAIESVLLRIAQLLADMPQVAELDINPLLADENGVVALDARMGIVPTTQKASERFAIRPYPGHLEAHVTMAGRPVLVRPIRPEDEADFKAFVAASLAADPSLPYFRLTRELPHSQLARFTQIDYDREMALVAICQGELIAEARALTEPGNLRAEFFVLVRPDWVGTQLGEVLLSRLIAYCSGRGTQHLAGDARSGNQPMLDATAALGFRQLPATGGAVRLELDLVR